MSKYNTFSETFFVGYKAQPNGQEPIPHIEWRDRFMAIPSGALLISLGRGRRLTAGCKIVSEAETGPMQLTEWPTPLPMHHFPIAVQWPDGETKVLSGVSRYSEIEEILKG